MRAGIWANQPVPQSLEPLVATPCALSLACVCSRRELVDRVVDGSLYGGLPRCGTCSVAVLKVRYPSKYGHKGQGQFFCPGYFDDDVFRRCGFSASDVDRPKWVAAVGQASSSSSPAAPKSSKPKEAKKATPPAPKVAMPGDDD